MEKDALLIDLEHTKTPDHEQKATVVSGPTDKLEEELEFLRNGLKNAPGPSSLLDAINPSLASTPVSDPLMSALQVDDASNTPTITPFQKMKTSLQNNVNSLDENLKLVASTVSNLAKTQARFADVVNNGQMDIKTYELAAQAFVKGPKEIYRAHKARTAKDVIDCTGCRFAWLKIEQDVGNSYSEKALYDSFITHCAGMQQSQIFFSVCNDMFSQVDDMIADYLNGHTVNQLCMNARMCR